MTRNYNTRFIRVSAPVVVVLAMLSIGGCKKKTTAALPPPPPAATGPAPTTQFAANPTVVNPGGQVVLTWHTTEANEVSIDQIGPVPTSGTRTVTPSESTTYHLTARGDGGTSDATARVTVNTGGTGTSAGGDTTGTTIDDNVFHSLVQDVFFDYDSYEINAEAQGIITRDAQYLASHPGAKVVVGGYCDERGSTEYNLALGENRANSAKVALTTAGVAPDRLRTVSFGKEKQFCSEHNEVCWQQNRRAQFSQDR